MNKINNKIAGFDFIRAFAIFFVFLAHIINKQSNNETVLLIERSISPGLTMSMLGFISAYLLVGKYKTSFNGEFYIKRLSRIYSSLFICLSVITILHIVLSYDVVNQHSIIHFMGLSFFMELFQVVNKSSLGGGLWFITIIIVMYLLLPLMTTIYIHKNSKFHLLCVTLICLFLNQVMYGTASSWNVIISFNIGCYTGLKSNIETFSRKSLFFYICTTLLLLVISALATSKIIPYQIRNILFPLYPFCAVPLFFKIGNNLTGFAQKIIFWFSAISYEVYIIHFYFINEKLTDLFPAINVMSLQIIIAFTIVLPLAYIFSKVGTFTSKKVNNYLILRV